MPRPDGPLDLQTISWFRHLALAVVSSWELLLKTFATTVTVILGFFGSVPTIWEFFETPIYRGAATAVALGLVILIVSIDTKDFLDRKPKVFHPKDEARINKFLIKWVQNPGQTAILSRNLSWAEKDDRAKQALIGKAKDDNLHLYVPKERAIIRELANHGATVTYIPIESTRSRFTIVSQGRTPRVAISAHWEQNHMIETVTRHDHYAFGLVQDLIDVFDRIHR